MDDLPFHKIQISGPTLASLLHRFTTSPGDIHGLLFGDVSYSTPSSLSDDPSTAPSTSASSSALVTTTTSHLVATITSFLSLPSHQPLPLHPLPHHPASYLLGWFSGRRKTPLRPSLKDSSTTHELSSNTSFAFSPQNSPQELSLPPSLFLLLTSPFQDQLIHTHEYKAFQYSISTDFFEPKGLNIVNIGPSFRSNYGSFTPHAPFPFMPFEFRGLNAMAEDGKSSTLKDQKVLDGCADGFEIGRLRKLMGADSANYTAELEDLYDKMLAKLDELANLVENSSVEVLEQENHNMKLRSKIAGLE